MPVISVVRTGAGGGGEAYGTYAPVTGPLRCHSEGLYGATIAAADRKAIGDCGARVAVAVTGVAAEAYGEKGGMLKFGADTAEVGVCAVCTERRAEPGVGLRVVVIVGKACRGWMGPTRRRGTMPGPRDGEAGTGD